jgi:hypothetical protein
VQWSDPFLCDWLSFDGAMPFELSAGRSNDHKPASRKGSTAMDVIIEKINGLWHLIVGSCQIRTPFLETQHRSLVVAYARQVYPGAKIHERD